MRKILRAVLVIISALAILLYIPACFVYFVSPLSWWPIGILGIGFPYLWLFLVALFCMWIVIKRRVAVLVVVLLIIGLPVIKNIVALHPHKPVNTIKPAGSIRVLQWNCQGVQGSYKSTQKGVEERGKMVAFLKKYNPDVLCLSEFNTVEMSEGRAWSNVALFRDSLGYKYFVFQPYYTEAFGDMYKIYTGNAIFSKYPIADSGFISYSFKKFPENILWANILFNGKKIHFVSTHLASMHLHHFRGAKNYTPIYLIEDSNLVFHSKTLDKIRYFQAYHVKQIASIKQHTSTVKIPMIFAGDLNSVPSSYVYKQIRGQLTDAFLEYGYGFGRSFHSQQPFLRIDYIFYNKGIQLLDWSIFHISFSDHDPVMTDAIIRQ